MSIATCWSFLARQNPTVWGKDLHQLKRPIWDVEVSAIFRCCSSFSDDSQMAIHKAM